MTDPDSTKDIEASRQTEREPYETPRLVVIGNARDLLAGGDGSVEDSIFDPDHPNKSSLDEG